MTPRDWLWLRPWLWRALLQRRKARRVLEEERNRQERRNVAGCDCGRIVYGSEMARGLRSFEVCPSFGCSKSVSSTRSIPSTRADR